MLDQEGDLLTVNAGNNSDEEWKNSSEKDIAGNATLWPPPNALYSIEEFHSYVIGVGAVTVCAVGMVSNIISLVILLRRDMVSTTYTFLTALAVSDITIIITGILLSTLASIIDTETDILIEGTYLPVIFPLLRPAALTCIFVSVWITVALTLDRYLAVCHHGMKIQTWFTVPRARKVVVCIFLIATIYNIPTFFEYKVEHIFAPHLNKTFAIYKATKLGSNQVFRQLYHSWLLLPFLWGLPFVCLSYMNIRLIIAVKRSRDAAIEQGQQHAPRGIDVTVMLIAIIINFLCCQSPHLVSSLIWALSPELYEKDFYMKLYIVSVLLVLINCSTNFFVYALFGRRFRSKLLEVFCRCLVRGRPRRGSSFSVAQNGCVGTPLLEVKQNIQDSYIHDRVTNL